MDENLLESRESNLRRQNPVEILSIGYEPVSIEINPNSVVTWTNDTSENHTVTSDENAFSSEVLLPGEKFKQPFDDPGEYYYHCELHGNEKGKVVVNELSRPQI